MKKTRTSALWTAALSAVAAAGLFASCDKTPAEPVTPPTVWPEAAEGLANRYQFKSAETVDIKSVVYDYSEDTKAYIFVFSTAEGAEEVEATLKNDSKAFGVIVPTLDGAVDTTKTWGLGTADQSFSVTYDKLTGNEHSAKLSFKLAEDGKLVASVEYIGETPDTYFFLKYEGACTRQYHEPTLVNQMLREDRKVTELKSLVVQTKRSHYYSDDNTLAFSFYSEEGVTAENLGESGAEPCLLVMLGEVLDVEEVNFATYTGLYTVMAGDLIAADDDEGTTVGGTFKFSETENGAFSVELDFSLAYGDVTKTVKAVYNGPYTTFVYASGFSYNDNLYDVPKTVFREKTADGIRYVFGSNAEATSPEQLKDGDFAVSVTVPADGLGEEYELKTASECKVELYDYRNYTTSVYDRDNLGAYGCVYVGDGEDDGKVLIQLEELEFADGVEIDGSAYSAVVDATIPDLAPAKPFTPTITITDEAGTEILFQKTITRMEVAHISGERDFAGTLLNAYLFYFVNSESEDDVDTAKYPNTPLFILPDNQFGKDDVDLYTAKGEDGMDLCWSLAFNNSALSAGAQSMSPAQGTYGYNLMGGYINRLPDYAVVTAKKNGADWDFKLVLKDWGCFTMYDTTTKSGTNNVLTIEWHGPATKYSGTKYTNTLTDGDYK